jgi:transposase
VEALRKRRAPGRPCRLNAQQLQGAAAIYLAGAREAGFDSGRWTTMRFAEAVYQRYGVRYDPDHAGRILHRLGLRERIHRQRAEEAPAAVAALVEQAS